MHKQLQGNSQSEDVDESENLEPVEWPSFVEDKQTWNRAPKVKDEVACQIIKTYIGKSFVHSGIFYKIQHDFKDLNYINRQLNFLQVVLDGSFTNACLTLIICIFRTGLVDVMINQNEWNNI